MKTRTWKIYSLSDPRTEEVRYIGVTFRGKQRFNEHISRAITGGKTHRDNWIRSLIADGVRPVFAIIEDGQGEGWQAAERCWIARYQPTGRLVNLTDGGEGAPGYVPTPELRAKWSQMRRGVPYEPGRIPAMLGKKHTPEAVAKIQRASTGRVMPETMRAKLSAYRKGKPTTEASAASVAARTGKPLSEAHKAKIAAATKNRKPVICLETGEIFSSITDAARYLGVNEASVNQAIRKGCRCKNYHWQFL